MKKFILLMMVLVLMSSSVLAMNSLLGFTTYVSDNGGNVYTQGNLEITIGTQNTTYCSSEIYNKTFTNIIDTKGIGSVTLGLTEQLNLVNDKPYYMCVWANSTKQGRTLFVNQTLIKLLDSVFDNLTVYNNLTVNNTLYVVKNMSTPSVYATNLNASGNVNTTNLYVSNIANISGNLNASSVYFNLLNVSDEINTTYLNSTIAGIPTLYSTLVYISNSLNTTVINATMINTVNLTITGNLTVLNNINASGNVTASYLIGMGNYLTNVTDRSLWIDSGGYLQPNSSASQNIILQRSNITFNRSFAKWTTTYNVNWTAGQNYDNDPTGAYQKTFCIGVETSAGRFMADPAICMRDDAKSITLNPNAGGPVYFGGSTYYINPVTGSIGSFANYSMSSGGSGLSMQFIVPPADWGIWSLSSYDVKQTLEVDASYNQKITTTFLDPGSMTNSEKINFTSLGDIETVSETAYGDYLTNTGSYKVMYHGGGVHPMIKMGGDLDGTKNGWYIDEDLLKGSWYITDIENFYIDADGNTWALGSTTTSVVNAIAPQGRSTFAGDVQVNKGVNTSEVNATNIKAYGNINVSGNINWSYGKEIALAGRSIKKPGVNPPGDSIINNAPTFDFDKDTNESIYMNIYIPTDYDNGTNMKFAFYWSPSTAGDTGNVTWCINYTRSRRETSLQINATSYELCVTDQSLGVQYYNQKTEEVIIPSSTFLTDDTIFFRVFRSATNASDTYDADALLTDGTIYYHSNRPGIME